MVREDQMEIQNISGPDVVAKTFSPESAQVREEPREERQVERQKTEIEGRGTVVDTYA
jgi:hypothetical protein